MTNPPQSTHAVGTAFIVAGGASSRMGQDKALLDLGGRPVIAHVAARVAQACASIAIIDREPERYAFLGLPVIVDQRPGFGPLSGLHAGLQQLSAHEPAFFAACDTPFLAPQLVRMLVGRSEGVDAVVPVAGGRPQPLCAVYRRSLLTRIEAALDLGGGSVIGLLRDKALNVRWVEEAELEVVDPGLQSFINLNTPDDYRRALRRLGH